MKSNGRPEASERLTAEQLRELLDWAESTDNWELVELSKLALQGNKLTQDICAIFVQKLREK